jgi:hypothetical protein
MGLFSLAKKSVKELVDLGYPETVAKKIANGELPMDEASREARASLMNMTDDRFLRGHSANKPPQSDEDMFMVRVEKDGDFPGSKAYGVAESYARGGEVYDEALDDYVQIPGEVTPLRHNAQNLFNVDVGLDDYSGAYARVPDFGPAHGSDSIAGAVKQGSHNNGWQGTRFEDMVDYYDNNASDGHATDIYNILGSRDDVQIRHADLAAFDPDYKGSSIMGTAAGTAGLLGLSAPEDAEAGVSFGLAKNVDLDRLVSAWQKAVSRNPEIDPSTHLQNIIHNKDFTNYNEFGEFARKADGGKNGDTYFDGLKPVLIDISRHPKVAKDNRLRKGLVQYADTRFAQRKKQGHRPDGQRGSADPYSLLPVAGVGLAASSLLAPQIKDSGMISSPRSETLASATMGLRDLERSLEGSPMSLLFPSGLVEYLETVNRREEDPNAMTRGMALLDVIP